MARADSRAVGGAGAGEVLFYAAVVALAAAPLDLLAATNAAGALVRAACWALVYGVCALLMLQHAPNLWPPLRRNALLLVLPLLALISTLWSSDPPQSAIAGLQVLSMVLFGTLIGVRMGRDGLAPLVLLALVPVALTAAAVTVAHPLGVDDNGDAVGVFSHKNTLGNRSAILALAAAALLLAGRLRLLALAGLGLALGLLAASGSRTAWVAAAVAAPSLLAARLARLPPAGWTAAIAGTGLLVCAAGAVVLSGLFDPVRAFFELLDRDPTMTGRTELWDLALVYVREAPLLGHGFDAFWDHDNPTAGAAFVASLMRQELPHFHNGYLEMAVQLGWTGMLLMAATTLFLLRRCLRLARAGVPVDGPFALGLLALVAVSDLAEVALIQRHGLALLLLSALAAQAVHKQP